MPVAKSYKELKQLCDPYEKNGRKYVLVKTNSGAEKEVRWYSDKEYVRMYPGESIPAATAPKDENKVVSITKSGIFAGLSQRKILGFGDACYITIIKGDVENYEPWLAEVGATYTRWWGWSFASDKVVPELPSGFTAYKLSWDMVGANDNDLKNETEIEIAVNNLIYGESVSSYQGAIGDRLTLDVIIKYCSSKENGFGGSNYFHVMIDSKGNEYTWNTSARKLEEGVAYHLSGTVKEFENYKGIPTTVLTRCKIL